MTLDSSNETVGILYDIENAPLEMLDYTLGQARRYQPCRTIVISDWDARPDQKRWEKLLRRPGFTFRQIDRTFYGKNSLDYALFDSAKLLYEDGVRRFFIITTDSDFVRIAEALNAGPTPSYIIGVGTKQASETLRSAYDEFLVYPPEVKAVKKAEGKGEAAKASAGGKGARKPAEATHPEHGAADAQEKPEKQERPAHKRKTKQLQKGDAAASAPKGRPASAKEAPPKEAAPPEPLGPISIRLPRTLQAELLRRREEEGVTMDELVMYLLTRGLAR